MIANRLTTHWDQIAAGLGNHLWQSTLVAVVAVLLTLVLRNNHARARYWIWLAASVKFLIPFAPLVALGQRMTWLRPTQPATSGFYLVMEQAGRPFGAAAGTVAPAVVPISTGLPHWLPMLVAAVWFGGFAGVILLWCMHWRRISILIRSAAPLREGREVETLRRLERTTGIGQRVEMLLSHATLEPGIFGMSRPVLLWPQGISEHLENQHLDAIIAHELWHVRRHDNLAAALHMLVEATFWFHPFVWWLGARLVDERERACDEKVLELGSERRVYAESVLKVCEFCVGSPLACVAGVTGADLKKRMVHIMSENIARKLDFGRKLLLSIVAALAIAAPILFGLANATPGRAQSQETSAAGFSSVTMKPTIDAAPMPTYAGGQTHMVKMMFGPDGFVAGNVSLQAIIEEAYGVRASQVVGGPDWMNADRFDVDAKADKSEGPYPGLLDKEKTESMLRGLLADRAKLALHRETRDLPTYALVVGDDGVKMRPSPASDGPGNMTYGPQKQMRGMRMQMNGNQAMSIGGQGTSSTDLAEQLSRQLGVPVVDKTGLKGNYDFTLSWTKGTPGEADGSASLLAAVQSQLGLRLEPQKQAMPVLVIDHVEKPSEN